MQAESLVDLRRYPLLDPAGRAKVVADARRSIEAEGSAVLPGFLTSDAVASMAAEARTLTPLSHRRDLTLGAYSAAPEPWMDDSHPVRRLAPYRMQVTATDQMAPDGPTLTIYEWPPLTVFVAEVLGFPKLYRVADPLMRCNFTILGDGDEHGWHFDQNEFVVSLLIQKAERGGIFEFVPNIRTEDHENYDDVRAVMDERSDTVRQIAADPGTLALFRGRQALHRVTRVSGPHSRIIALFSFDTRPNMHFGPDSQRRVFARTQNDPAPSLPTERSAHTI